MHDTFFYREIPKCPAASFQHLKIPIDELAIVGSEIVVDVPIKGNIMRNLYFDMGQYTLDTLEFFEILVSGTVIFRFTGEYIYMLQMLNTPKQKKALLDTVITIPIGPFIPVMEEMRIHAKLTSPIIQKASIGLSAEFAYAEVPSQIYPIQQMQLQYGSGSNRLFLKFTNCVKELFIVIQNTSKAGTFDFSNVSGQDQVTNIELNLNQYRKVSDEPIFFRGIQPMMYHTSAPAAPSLFYVYSFAKDPQSDAPSGTVNMSRVANQVLTLTFSDTDAKNVRVYATSYNHLYVSNGSKGTLKFPVG